MNIVNFRTINKNLDIEVQTMVGTCCSRNKLFLSSGLPIAPAFRQAPVSI